MSDIKIISKQPDVVLSGKDGNKYSFSTEAVSVPEEIGKYFIEKYDFLDLATKKPKSDGGKKK